MLLNQNQLAREVQCISRIAVTVAGIPANSHDIHQFQTCTILRYGLEADLLPGSAYSRGLYRRSIHSIDTIDLQSYAADMKVIKLAYLERLDSPSLGDWQHFKRAVSGKLHYKWLLTVPEKLYMHPENFLQWVVFDERMLLTSNDDISLEIKEYIDFEADLAERQYPEGLVAELAEIIGEFLQDFEPSFKHPEAKFGPGATAELGRVPPVSKASNICYDLETAKYMADRYWTDLDQMIVGSAGNASWRNRIIFVPKNALKHRIISAEPTWLTWLQQAIKQPLYDYVEKSPKMNTWFSDQGRSRWLAWVGSKDGSYATVDSSSASDAITVRLVDGLYRRAPIHDLLLMTRSRECELPDGTIIPLAKFAPMGSATCFPTMDIIFLAVCEYSVRKTLRRAGQPRDYIVFGDDVVIRTDCLSTFLSVCSALMFRINTEKSYWNTDGSHYREACGGEYYNGRDITPLRYSRFQDPILDSSPVRRQYWESTFDLMNRCVHPYWFPNMRSAIVELIKLTISRGNPHKRAIATRIWNNALRIDMSDYPSEDGPLHILVPDGTATNYRARHGYDANLQRPYVRCYVPVEEPVDHHSVQQEELLLELWHHYARTDRASDDGNPSQGYIVGACAGTHPCKWVWKRVYT
jgi:hypothetical protein